MAETRGRIDHLVVAARTLDEGVAWCEATLGVTPGPGGAHLLFGTHNRLLKLDGSGAYLEIIAIDSKATPTRAAPLRRWFDLDDPAMHTRLAQHGPQLVHWVARVPHIGNAVAALQAIGIQRGPVVSASRQTPEGLLQWHISVRDDGQRLYNGALPTLIQWAGTHPTEHLPDSGVTLRQLRLRHAGAAGLRAALHALDLDGLTVSDGPAILHAELDSPARGRVHLLSSP